MDKYEEISRDLREGKWGKSGKLPSCRQLAGQYNCSLSVIQQALKVLDKEGEIRSFAGRGTFWIEKNAAGSYKANSVIGVSFLSVFFNNAIEDLKFKWLKKGYFLSGYNADIHMQNPANERDFILMARKEHFSGLVLLATPFKSDNAALCNQMRLEGMKIAHLIPHLDDMSNEPMFSADYKAAGRLAAAGAAMAGFHNVVFWTNGESPDRTLTLAGIKEMVSGLGLNLLPDFDTGHTYSKQDCLDYLEGKAKNTPAVVTELLNLPPRTCILTQSQGMLRSLIQIARHHGIDVPGTLGGIAMDGGDSYASYGVDTIVYDRCQQLNDALEYVADSSISSLTIVHKFYAPKLVRFGTLISE